MANVYGYKSKLIALIESAYGTVASNWTNGYAHNDTTIDIADSTELVDRMVRSGQLGEISCETVDGRVGGQVTITGALSAEKNWMFSAIGLTTSGANEITFGIQSASYSFTLARDFGNGKVDVAYGCVATSFELSNDDNFINYSITFDAQEVKFGQTKTAVFASMTGVEPAVSCEVPFRTKDFGYTPTGMTITPLSFTLSINNELDEDKVNFGIGNKKVRAVVSKTTGEFTVEGLLVSGTQIPEDVTTEVANVLSIGGKAKDLTISFGGKISARSIPDVERGAYVQSITQRIVKIGSVAWMISTMADAT